jgi:tyrosinase
MSTIEELQTRTKAFLKRRPPRTALRSRDQRFSSFDPAQMDRALSLTSRFVELANATNAEAGLEAVLEEAEQAAGAEDLDLVKFALMVFITHHPQGRPLPIPSLEEREPEKVAASPQAVTAARPGAVTSDEEAQLNWYREDPKANEHHEHWHVVYPFLGIPDVSGTGPNKPKDRQGELFWYMHEQMLARYDTERIALGMARVRPLSDYREVIEDGYDSGISGYSPRPAMKPMSDIEGYTIHDHELTRDRLLDAADSGYFRTGATTLQVDADSLGGAQERSIRATELGISGFYYGSHHNRGHMLLARIHDPMGSTLGVMADTATAIRDPIFYRWHKHVDDIAFRWQRTQQPNDLSDFPPVSIRKGLDGSTSEHQSPDIILCFKDRIPGADEPGWDGQAYGERTFGGEHWDEDFSSSNATTAELHTMMLRRSSEGVEINYLDQREFFYFLRVENLVDQTTDVTVRIFLVAQEVAEDRRMWIEMDKFRYTLQPSKRAVVFRPAALAAVIRKPATKPPGPNERPSEDPHDEENYCECGWPYNLLLPRGTREGMGFRFMVMMTDWKKDQVSQSTCGSMSFCGAKDKYPDKRGMGYPFDRPFRPVRPPATPIATTIATQPNMATRDITIMWV